MYPRAEAYIISVKQSTYCQFREVIRAHTERQKKRRGEGLLGEGRQKEKKTRQEVAEEVGEETCIVI